MNEPETGLNRTINLASERLGAVALAANDEFFASKDNLLKDADPIFVAGKYTDRGHWMDGWETRRRREPGHDWCLLRLGLPGRIRRVILDTSHFIGNYAPEAWIEGAYFQGQPSVAYLQTPHVPWHEVLPRSALAGDRVQAFAIDDNRPVTHLRLSIDPDGGVARLRVWGEVEPDSDRIQRSAQIGAPIDLAAIENGGCVVDVSDDFFGSSHHLLLPGPSLGMFDGWETRRRRTGGHDWALVALGPRGSIEEVEVDTSHFKGNAPGWCSLEVSDEGSPADQSHAWREILPKTALEPHARHRFPIAEEAVVPARFARLNIYPDGGVARLRLTGRVLRRKDGES